MGFELFVNGLQRANGGGRKVIMGLLDSIRRSRFCFEWRYVTGKTPWDTNVTPPEVMEFIAQHPPGWALDLGCGTGTNAITLAKHGWKVTGVDFSAKAIKRARQKANAAGVKVEFIVGDVADLSLLNGPYDYALDIGCLLSLSSKAREGYAKGLKRLVKPGGWYMLYAWLPRKGKEGTWGTSKQEVEGLIGHSFEKIRVVVGQERGLPSAWYWFRRRKGFLPGTHGLP